MTIVALGALLLPMLTGNGYSERYSLGLVTTSGSLGLLIVPSVPLILYGIVAQQMDVGERFTIQQLFLAGIAAGATDDRAAVRLDGAASRWHAQDAVRPARALWRAVKAARWELPLPFVVLGGIYSGPVRHFRSRRHDCALRAGRGSLPLQGGRPSSAWPASFANRW